MTHIPRMLPQLCGTWCQEQLSCVCTEHLPAPGVTVKVQECVRESPPGIFHVSLCILILVRPSINLLASLDERNSVHLYWAQYSPATPNDSRETSCCKCGLAGTSYVLGKAQESPKEKSTHLESLVWELMISKSLNARSYSLHIPKSMINIDRGNGCIKQSWNESLLVLNTD